MYYVLFHYTKGRMNLGVQGCTSEADVIKFLHEQYKEIDLHRIIEVKAEYCLGLIETEEYIKSALEPKEEAESLVPIEVVNNAKAILRENKEKLEEPKEEEPSAMEKIGDDIAEEMKEDELTDEQKAKRALDMADELIEREKKRQEQKKKGWRLCSECNSNRISPANKKGICTPCQMKRKTNRPYVRHKEFKGL